MKNNFLILIIGLLCCGIISCVETEVEINGSICGQIFASGNEQSSIAGCTITLDNNEKFRTISGDAGYYEFPSIKIGIHHIEVSKEGYITKRDSVLVSSGRSIVFDIALTKIVAPTIQTKPATSISFSSAILNGEIYDNGGGTINQRGFYWGESLDALTCINLEIGSSEFEYVLSELEDGKVFYYQAFASNEAGEGRGELLSFCTNEYSMVSIRAIEAENVSQTEALIKAEIASKGNSEISEFGFIYYMNPENEIKIPITSLLPNNRYEYLLTELKDGCTYYYKAYAINQKGISYSEEMSFTTLYYTPPVVVTNSVGEYSYTTASISGYIDSDGGAEIISCGFCFAKHNSPTIEDHVVECKTIDKNIVSNLQNLEAGTNYFIRAYAKNKVGTSYGNEVSFTTFSYGKATIETKEILNIGYNSADIRVKILNDGGNEITATGVCYSTEPSPTIEGDHTSYRGNQSEYVLTIGNLKQGDKYYARAFAINAYGTSYGNEVYFNTLKHNPPIFGDLSIWDIQYTSFSVGCSVNYSGRIVERGFCYSLTSNPTIEDSYKCKVGSGTGNYVGTINNLIYSKNYYVRAYATDETGDVSYSDEYKVITLTPQSLFTIEDGKRVTFSKGNLQYCPQKDEWRFAQEQYTYIGYGNSSISSSYSGWIDLFGWGTGNNPEMSSTSSSNYSTFSEWGNNIIEDYSQGCWRTLSKDEWYYIIYKRPNAASLYGMATVAGVSGLIILSDDFQMPTGINFIPATTNYSSNVYSASNWERLEENGAVFLPASGSRTGNEVRNISKSGCYWSSTKGYNPYDSDIYACSLIFELKDTSNPYSTGGVKTGLSLSCTGYSVRLVRNLY